MYDAESVTRVEGGIGPDGKDQRDRKRQVAVNRNEWRIIGLSRSGNHAIINWMLAHMEGRVCFLNCAEPKSNPFISARPMGSGMSTITNFAEFNLQEEQQGKVSPKDYLLYSYEDCFLGLLNHAPSEVLHDEWMGRSDLRRNLLILRDPFNLFASRMHYGLDQIPHGRAMQIWKQHARDALGARRYLPSSRMFISYNDWVASQSYRQQLAEELGLDFTDSGVDEVPDTAGGSSFDGLRYHRDASRMRVLDRWQEFADDDNYWSLFDDEVIRLSNELFGSLPSMERVLARRRLVLEPGLSAANE